MLSSFDRNSVVRRGVFVRERLLCGALPPPPPNVNVSLTPVSSTASNREIVVAHARDPACSLCHNLIDPIGVGFEKYDPTGVYREQEKGRILDDSGEVVGSPIGKFKGVVELASKMAAGDEAARCFARAWLRFALGRPATASDDPDIERLRGKSASYRATILELTALDSFLYRPIVVGGGA
jgi:hypothetical protein